MCCRCRNAVSKLPIAAAIEVPAAFSEIPFPAEVIFTSARISPCSAASDDATAVAKERKEMLSKQPNDERTLTVFFTACNPVRYSKPKVYAQPPYRLGPSIHSQG